MTSVRAVDGTQSASRRPKGKGVAKTAKGVNTTNPSPATSRFQGYTASTGEARFIGESPIAGNVTSNGFKVTNIPPTRTGFQVIPNSPIPETTTGFKGYTHSSGNTANWTAEGTNGRYTTPTEQTAQAAASTSTKKASKTATSVATEAAEEAAGSTTKTAAKKPGFFARTWKNHAPKCLQPLGKWMGEDMLSAKTVTKAQKSLSETAQTAAREAYIKGNVDKSVSKAVENLGENASKDAIKSATERATEQATQRAEAKLAGKHGAALLEKAAESSVKSKLATTSAEAIGALGKVSKGGVVLGVAIDTIHEGFEVAQGFKEGRGGKQLGKSALTIAGSAAGTWAGIAAGTKVGFAVGTAIGGPIGSAVGAVTGFLAGTAIALVGHAIGNKTGGAIFGDNKGDEVLAMEAAQERLNEQQEQTAQPRQFGTVTGHAGTSAGGLGGGIAPVDLNDPLSGLPGAPSLYRAGGVA